MLFFIDLTLVIFLTADFNTLFGNLFYKDGIFHWFLIGLELNYVLQNIIENKALKTKIFLI